MSDIFSARQKLIGIVKRKISSEWYAEEHPEDPHGGDEDEYCDDMIDEAARNLTSHLNVANPDPEAKTPNE